MKPFRNQKGFTLIELLIVVAIIGVLAAVGIPMYNGYIASAKVNASKENHNRIRDFIAAEFTKCAAGGTQMTLKYGPTVTTKFNCNLRANQMYKHFVIHFNSEGFKNPYNAAEACCYPSSGTNPAVGRTHIWSGTDYVTRITTRVEGTGSNQILSSTVTKE